MARPSSIIELLALWTILFVARNQNRLATSSANMPDPCCTRPLVRTVQVDWNLKASSSNRSISSGRPSYLEAIKAALLTIDSRAPFKTSDLFDGKSPYRAMPTSLLTSVPDLPKEPAMNIKSGEITPTPLHELRDSMQTLCDSIADFSDLLQSGPHTGILYRAPILEARVTEQRSILDGLTKFRTLCDKELGIIERMLKSPSPPHDLPSTNATYLISTWDEIISAEGPLWSINRLYVLPESYSRIVGIERDGRMIGGSEVQVKVDLVGKGGREWIKVNTIKLSRLMSEIHQEDAHRAYSDSSSEASSSASSTPASPFYPINSLTKQAYALKETARLNPLQSGKVPQVVMRLTRMSENDLLADDRVKDTLECIERMGVEVRLGSVSKEKLAICDDDRNKQAANHAKSTTPSLRISHKINLDLSLLIALISDITHAPLPTSPADADIRFVPTPKVWKRKVNSQTGEVSTIQLEEAELGAEEHTRALSIQLKQEMDWSLVEELEAKLEEAIIADGVGRDAVELWTTVEAKERCLEIVSKIGGEGERRRARAMLESPEEDFWVGSRYQGRGGLLHKMEIRLFPEPLILEQALDSGPYTFRKALATTCRTLLNPELKSYTNFQHIPLENLSLKPLRRIRVRDPARGNPSSPFTSADSTDSELPIGKQKKRKTGAAPENARIPTAHTVKSMLQGANRGITTITANRMSVKQMVRAMGSMEGLEDEFTTGAPAQFLVVEPKTLAEIKRSDWVDPAMAKQGEREGKAEIWAVEPRSLAEAMRADYAGQDERVTSTDNDE